MYVNAALERLAGELTLATAIPNCSDFVIKKEDHTIGNLVSEHAKLHPNVLVAGYKSMPDPPPVADHDSPKSNGPTVNHPNVAEIFVRIQTDGVVTPKDAFIAICQKILRDLTHLSQEFAREWELRRMVNEGEQQNQEGNA